MGNEVIVNSEEDRASGAPIGTIVAYYGTTTQLKDKAWLICDGSKLSEKEYILLAEHLKQLGLDSEHVPDLRGQFLRGSAKANNTTTSTYEKVVTENRSKVNNGQQIGGKQEDAIWDHKHNSQEGSKFLSVVSPSGGGQLGSGHDFTNLNSTGNVVQDSEIEKSKISEETRPVNIAIHWIIKAK